VPGGEEVMPERRIVLSRDKMEFLENWKMDKHDHLQELIQHVEAESKLQNHTHSIDAHTHDIFFTGLTLLPVDVAKKVLSECTFFTSYLHNYKVGHFLDKSDLSGHHLMILFFPHGESIPKYWSYLLHQIAHYILGHFDHEAEEKTEAEKEAEANELACKWVSESPYLIPRDNFEHCSCPQGTIDFCKALATTA
jgi:hypothetical protein